MINKLQRKTRELQKALSELYKKDEYNMQYVNLFGIRDQADIDEWNDALGYFTPDGFCNIYQGTTDPGKHYTDKPMNSGGAAWMSTGFHPDLWSLGLHRGYPALVQVSPVAVQRDKDKDYKPEKKKLSGLYGINMHRAHRVYAVDSIGRYGAGCQVIRKPADWFELYGFCEKYKQRRYSYLLLTKSEASDLIGVDL